MLTVLLDNSCGVNTPGKRSPEIDFINRQKKLADRERTAIDNAMQFREYIFTRQVIKEVAKRLDEINYNVVVITPEETDISLSSRIVRINTQCAKYGASKCVMISVGVNTTNRNNWIPSRGWSVCYKNEHNNSDKLSECMYTAANEIFKANKDLSNSFKSTRYKLTLEQIVDENDEYESNVAIISGTNCPAVMIKNFFIDNKEDIKYLESKQGFEDIVNVIVQGIIKYTEKYKKV